MARLAAAALTLALLARGADGAPASPPGAGMKRADDVLPFRAVERTLANGLRVIVVPTGFPGLVSVHLSVQTGSRNEVEPGKSGFAHFFEHMMFRGTRRYPAARYQEILTRLGAQQNAYTSDDLTSYHVTFAKEDLDTVLELEADRFMNLEYPVDLFKTEARAVLGEYDKSASNPLVKLEEAQRDAAFAVHPYRHTTMGFLADIEDMPNQYEYSRLFYARWYRPELTTLVVAGDVAPGQVLPMVERRFGAWRRGAPRIEIPQEPPPAGPAHAHVAWRTPTLPWVTVAFRGPAFSDTRKDWAALSVLYDLHFGETSELHRRLVVEEQIVDALSFENAASIDPGLHTVSARVKRPEDAPRVRDEILRTFARARSLPPEAGALADQLAHARSALVRSLDSTEAVAAVVARFAAFERSYATVNRLHRTLASLSPEDVLAAARAYLTDERLVVTTLSHEPLPAGVGSPPPLGSFAPAPEGGELEVVTVASPLPVVTLKLLFQAGSARDPVGKEGLAAIAAAMLVDAGTRRMRIDEIHDALHPLAASFSAQVDKELVTLTGTFPRDGWERFAEVALPQLTAPGFREEDFRRVKDEHRNALVQDLREANEEELAKERLQANLFAGGPYRHPALGTVAGIEAVTLDDVKAFVRERYVRADLVVGVGGDAPAALVARLRRELAALPQGQPAPPTEVRGRRPRGIEVEIVEKETRGTAISLGHPIDVVRGHPDFVALWLARTWLGEHRSATSHLYQRIREVRGLNYGDYAYIEAFPRGMFQTTPEPNVGRRAQLFEIWIRPVAPRNAHMALRIALHELRRLVAEGLSEEQFRQTRAYLERNALVLAARQDDRVGHALDARWFGTPALPDYLAQELAKLTRDGVNGAIRRHLSGSDLSVVAVTKDAKALAEALVADGPSAVTYDADQPPELLEEDRRIGAMKLGIRPEAVRTTKVEEVFAR
jgi:zinc protease